MAKIFFSFRKKEQKETDWNMIEKSLSNILEEDTIEKSRPVKYIQRIPTGKTERPWYYIYQSDLLHPFRALKEIFGLGKEKLSKDYEDNNIKKEYGVDKDTWGKHVLEFFRHKTKWNKTFADKKARDQYKKPIQQKTLQPEATANLSEGEKPVAKKQTKTGDLLNRSLMRKVWSIYSPEAKNILQAEKDEKVIEKKVEEPVNSEKKQNDKIIVAPQEFAIAKKVIPANEYAVVLENASKGEEQEYFKQKIKDVVATVNKLIENAGGGSYNSETEQHDKGYMHYFVGSSDWYICELDGDEAFGYTVLNGDTQNAEYGYIDMNELMSIRNLELDLYTDQSKTMEQAIYQNYPELKGELLTTAEEYNSQIEEAAPKYETVKNIFDSEYEKARYDYIFNGLVLEDGATVMLGNDLTDAKLTYRYFTGPHNTDWSKYDINETLKDIADSRSTAIDDFDKETISNYAKEKAIQDVLREFINGTLDKESEAEKHENRSQAMLGNQNAYKGGTEDKYEGATETELNTWENDEVRITNDMYKDSTESELVEAKKEAEQSLNNYEQYIREFTDKLENPDDPGMFATAETIAENERALKANRKQMQLYAAQAKGKIRALNEMILEHGNKTAMLGNDNAKKYGIEDIDEKENQLNNESVGEKDNGNQIDTGRISERDSSIRTERSDSSAEDSGIDGTGSEQRSSIELDSLQPGERSGSGETAQRLYNTGSGDLGRKLKKSEILKIREECEKLLNEKKDEEFTEADKALLRQYAGAGGTDIKDATNAQILNEYYTPYKVIDKVWQLVDKYNPKQDKTVLEPSAGIGRFAEGRPEKFTMCEIDNTTSRINRILHPDAKVITGEFQSNFMKDGVFSKDFEKFDVVIGNPPYGKYSGRAKGKGEGKDHSRIEEYFIDRSLDTLKDGGILAMVIPSSVLRSGDTKTKKILESKGELLEAWRLPNGTFDTTDVGTDIIIMRKGKGKPGSLSNDNYFNENPQCVLGAQTQKTDRFNKDKFVDYVSMDGKSVDEILDSLKVDAVSPVQVPVEKANVTIEPVINYEEQQKLAQDAIKDNFIGRKTEIDKKTGNVKYTFKDGRTIVRTKSNKVIFDSAQGGELSEAKVKAKKTEIEKHNNRSKAMLGNDNAKGAHDYPPSAGHCMTASEFSAKYTGRNIDPTEMEIWRLNDWTGKVDPSMLNDEQKAYVEKSDRYVMNGGKYENIVTYASGNIHSKIDSLDKNDPQYDKKLAILKAALPTPKKIEEITLNPLDSFARQFNVSMDEKDTGMVYRYGGWSEKNKVVKSKGLISEFFKWARFGLNNSPVGKYDIPEDITYEDIIKYIMGKNSTLTERDEPDPNIRALKNMKIKNARAKTAKELFNRFLREGLDPETQKRLVSEWNNTYNSNVNPDYSKLPVFVEGMSTHKGSKEFNMLDQQIKGVSFLANKGSGILAYDVGVGKTVTGIVATVNQIQTGRAKRPLICVPAPVYEKWIKEIHQHFPDQEVIPLGNMGKQFFDPETKEAIIHDKETKQVIRKKIQDGALLVCTYEALDNIGFTEETENEIYQDVEFATDNPFGKKDKRKKAEASEKVDETVGAMTKTKGTNDVLIEELGIDHITVDEIHNFNHVFASPRVFATNDENDEVGTANEYSGMGGAVSAMGQKLFAVTQYIQRHNDNRNVYGLSATPFTNKPAEVYSVLSLVARQRLKELGITSLQEFMRKFADITMEYVVKPKKKRNGEEDLDGGMEVTQANVMKGFENLNVLQSLIKEYFDKVDGEEAGVIRPHKKTITPMLEKSDLQAKMLDYELKRMSSVGKENPGAAINAMTNMRQILLSPSFVNEELKQEYQAQLGIDLSELSPEKCVENSPKLKFVCDSVIEQWKTGNGAGQFIYVPRGVKHHEQIKKYLIAHGMPEDSIELLGNEEGSTDKKLKAKAAKIDAFNDPNGKLKVIIGNESTKEGVSLNGNATTVYNTMLGWNPTEVTQVEGRVWRQGNKQGVTSVVYPLIYDSLDARLYQLYEEKKGRIDSIFSYKGDSLNVEDIKADEMKFALIKDPEVKAGMQIDQEKQDIDNEMRLIDSKRDTLHEAVQIFDNPVEDDYNYKRYREYEKTYNDRVESKKSQLEEIKKYSKDLSSKDEDKRDMAEYKLRNIMGLRTWQQVDSTTIDDHIKTFKSDIDADKKQVAAYKKEADRLVYQYQKRVENLNKQGLHNSKDIEEKIDQLSVKKMKLEKQKDGLEGRKKELVNKYREELIQERAVMPTIDEQVKTVTNMIVSTLTPMDDVRSWIKDMRAQGMSNEEIKQEVDRRVTKSFAMFNKKNGHLYFRKSMF